jgi:hypothetical protein
MVRQARLDILNCKTLKGLKRVLRAICRKESNITTVIITVFTKGITVMRE